MKMSLKEALARLPSAPSARYPQGAPFADVMAHGSMAVEIYAPQGEDLQQPHTRDELYFVIEGHGRFINGDASHDVGPGDCLFVAAGVEHRFIDFTPDFKTWVVFYGPEGGEAP
jgi:mannose-6-phosphate isomerase-like protein (cupin superfamily)